MKILVLLAGLLTFALIVLLCVNSKENYKGKLKTFAQSTNRIIPIVPRRMWGWVGSTGKELGYCGETCVQSIGLYYGNYISQGIVNWACGGKVDGRTFVIGDTTARRAMQVLNFNISENLKIFSADGIRDFLDTTLNKQGFPIIMGWFDWASEDSQNPDYQYDHIMTTIGYNRDSDTIYFLDNYLLEVSQGTVGHLFQDRGTCNSNADFIPQPFIYCIPNQLGNGCKTSTNCLKSKKCSCNYFIVVTGNVDPDNELLPVSLSIDRPDEPDWGLQDGINRNPVQINAIATVSDLTPGQKYVLIRFDGPRGTIDGGTVTKNPPPFSNPVPPKNFLNACKTCKNYPFTANNNSMIIQNNITTGLWSDGSYFYRCVKA